MGHRRRHQRALRSSQRSRRKRIRTALGRAGDDRGRFRERLVGDALALLKERGCITAYYLCPKNGKEDRRGVDAGIIDLQGQEIKFQIKGSYRGVQKHLRKHPDIPYVDVGRCTYPADAAVLIQRIFNLFPLTS